MRRLLFGAEGRIRTDTEVALQQFLRLPRLPFRHFGSFLQTGRKTRFKFVTSLTEEAFYR